MMAHRTDRDRSRTRGWLDVVRSSRLAGDAAPGEMFRMGLLVLLAIAGRVSYAQGIDFNRDIRPILSDRCFPCHGPDEAHREADLRLDDLRPLMEEQAERGVIVPGEPSQSLLWQRISSQDADERMPPADSSIRPLTAAEQRLIEQWIASGAEWRPHWAYRRPQLRPPPPVKDRTKINNWIDQYVQGELERRGAGMSPRADLTVLARRLSFDLTGLPPSNEDVVSLANDPRPDRLQRWVDRLLSSPAFGERMAVYWLDLVRYADTVGYHGDQDHNASPYRDYVIDAFNDNMPMDRFTIEQLAGDLLPDPTEEQIIATCYNRLLQTSHEGGVQPKEYLAIYGADRVRNLSAVWMGATLGCAQCHDHKYDPFTSRDFYSVQAFFADIDEAQHFKVGSNSLPTRRPPEITVFSRAARLQLQQRIEQREEADAAGDAERVAALDEEIEKLRKQSGRQVMITRAIKPRTIRVLPRGNWMDDSGPIVEPAVPEFLGSLQTDGRRATRYDLARWLVDPDQGVGLLTARVMVNRLWMLMFGHGLSRSVDDFGAQGEPPSHPELLDRLAIEFVESGWDVKHMMRLIAASHAYQQSSRPNDWQKEQDPENRWLSRQNRYRLPAEMVRDTMLALSGLLVREIGGPSVKPYQPAGYYRHLNFPKRTYQASRDEGQWRRGVYVHWQRQFLHPMLKAFDAPSREECTARRPISNTPLAALVELNDPSLVEAARALALQFIRSGDDSDRIDAMIEHCACRPADPAERAALLELLNVAREEFAKHPASADAFLQVGMFRRSVPESLVEQAAWAQVARAILNTSEVITRE